MFIELRDLMMFIELKVLRESCFEHINSVREFRGLDLCCVRVYVLPHLDLFVILLMYNRIIAFRLYYYYLL